MATEPKNHDRSMGNEVPSELFAHMPRWEQEMKRTFGDLCNREEQSTAKSNLDMRKAAIKLTKERDAGKEKT